LYEYYTNSFVQFKSFCYIWSKILICLTTRIKLQIQELSSIDDDDDDYVEGDDNGVKVGVGVAVCERE